MKKWSKEEIRFNLETKNSWLIKALLAIYNLQTHDEKYSDITKHENGIGFNSADANYLSYVAKSYLNGSRFSSFTFNKIRIKMLKYSGQLAKIANKSV